MDEDQLVLEDDQGNFYVLSRATLDAARVGGARKAELERAMRETNVSGYALLITQPNSTFPTVSPSGEFKRSPASFGSEVGRFRTERSRR